MNQSEEMLARFLYCYKDVLALWNTSFTAEAQLQALALSVLE